MDVTQVALSDLIVGDALAKVPLSVQVGVLALVFGCAGWLRRRPGVVPLIGFTACSLMWWRANNRLEGPILWTFAPGHGLVTADLIPPILGLLALGPRRLSTGDGRRSTLSS